MESNSDKTRKLGRPLSFDRIDALEKAMLTFWRHGYETTSISVLTEAMGVTAPSIYTVFGDKKRLFLEAMRLYAGSPEDFEQFLADAPTAGHAVRSLLLTSAELFTGENTPRGCLLASATASGSKESEDVRAAVAEVRREVMDLLCARIEHDVATGVLPDDTRVTALASFAMALIQGMSVLARDGAQRAALKEMVDTAMAAWPPEHDLS